MRQDKSGTLGKMLVWVLVIGFSLVWGLAAALADDDGESALSRLYIQGPSYVGEGTAVNYTARARFGGETYRTVTNDVRWSVNSAAASISSSGVLTAQAVSIDQKITISARYSSDGITKTARKNVTIRNTSAAATLSSLAISGPATVNESSSATYTATASFSDGSTQNVTGSTSWSENSAYASISATGNLSTNAVSGDQNLSVSASYTSDGVTRNASLAVTIKDAVPAVTGSHAGRFTIFEGTKTCLQCHEVQGREVHGSVHYQWKGDTTDLVNPAAPLEGKLGGINDFCIYPDINWIGKLTDVNGVQVDGGCAKCHVGLGDKPSTSATQAQLENIDCLICHAPSYKRKVDSVGSAFKFVPDTAAMSVSVLQAASDIRLPTKDTCLNCHTKSGGGDNYKRGDIEEAHRNPSADFDVHMASAANGGKGLNCLDCHTAVAHKIAGRGSDLRPRESYDAVDCLQCHNSRPHGNNDINKHTARVNCTVCHIPTFAKSAPTDMERDWSIPGELDAAKGLFDPFMVKQSNVVPEYKFWNGQSQFYNFGTSAVAGPNGRILMSGPVGDVTTPGAKIYAFKHHLGTQPIDVLNDRLLPLKIGIFFQNNDIDLAVTEGVKGVGWPNNGYTFALTERYLGLFHEVVPKSKALSCNSCHGGTRLKFDQLGYTPNATYNGRPLCASCHSSKSASFTEIHSRHVTRMGYDCSRCHGFSKAQ